MSELQEAIDLMEAAIRDSVAIWERGEAPSPSARDLVYHAQRAVGIGTDYMDISEDLIDDFWNYEQESHTDRECAEWLARRFFPEAVLEEDA